MSLQVIKNINVDFYDKKYILINAKQYDDVSRYISITCYDQGKIFDLSANKHSVYVKYKKADGKAVLNFCQINYKGEVLVELTEQMLAADGICYVDLIVVNKGKVMVNIDTGEIIAIDDSPILSTMAFYINVYESSVDNSVIESSYEYDGLNEALKKAEAEYTEVIQLSKSYAIGDAGNIRDNENVDNSKYYYQKSLESANKSATSEANANSYMNTTNTYMNTTKSYMDDTKSHMDNAKSYMDNAQLYMDNAKTSEINALKSEQNAKASETNAGIIEANISAIEVTVKSHMDDTKSYMDNAAVGAQNAATSEKNALNNYNLAKSYAVGDTGVRDGEDTDNAKYYYSLIKDSALYAATLDEVRDYLGI